MAEVMASAPARLRAPAAPSAREADVLTADYDRAVLLRLCALMLIGLSVVGVVALVGEAADQGDVLAVNVAALAVMLVSGLLLMLWRTRAPDWVLVAAPIVPAAMIGLNVLFAGGTSRPVWAIPVGCLAYVGRGRAAVVLVAAIGVVLGVGLVTNETMDIERPVATWFMTMGAVAGVGYLVHRLRLSRDAEAGALVSLARALDLRDTGTASHSTTVGRLSEALALAAGLPLERARSVGLAGVLHDVGKVGVPDAILRKPGALDDEEWILMRGHAAAGAEIVASAGLDGIAIWIGQHHERLDGSGYPGGLHAEQITVEARILAITDAYEAMITDRPYRAGRSAREACAELRREAGGSLDPVLVGLFHDVVADELRAEPPREPVPA